MRKTNQNALTNLRKTFVNERPNINLNGMKLSNTNLKNNQNKNPRNKDHHKEQRGTLVAQNNKSTIEINHSTNYNRNLLQPKEEKRHYISNEEHDRNIEEILDYFENHISITLKVTKKTLKSHNIKTFYEILELLLKDYDTNTDFSCYLDDSIELINFLLQIGYPYVIYLNGFQQLDQSNNWQHCILILTWITSLINEEKALLEKFETQKPSLKKKPLEEQIQELVVSQFEKTYVDEKVEDS